MIIIYFYSVLVDLYVLYHFLFLFGCRMNSALWRSYPESWLGAGPHFWNSVLSLTGSPVLWHMRVGSGICRFLSPLRGSSWACPGAVGWQRQAGELRGTQVTLLEVLQKKAVSAEHFSFDKLLNSMLLFSFLLGSCVYLHIYLCAGRGRNRCFLMFQM